MKTETVSIYQSLARAIGKHTGDHSVGIVMEKDDNRYLTVPLYYSTELHISSEEKGDNPYEWTWNFTICTWDSTQASNDIEMANDVPSQFIPYIVKAMLAFNDDENREWERHLLSEYRQKG